MGTPYITPAELLNMPTGISWSTIPGVRSSSADAYSQQYEICLRASAELDGFCLQPLRATVQEEELEGPDFRLAINPNGNAVFLTLQWPVISTINAAVCPSRSFPVAWQTIGAGNIRPRQKLTAAFQSVPFGQGGTGLNEIEIAPGWIGWSYGRSGTRALAIYVAGWPHAGITSNVLAGATTIDVDDVTGWVGYTGMISDGSSTESVIVTAASATNPITVMTGDAVQAGPGTVTLAAPLQYAHSSGTNLSALPWDLKWATALYAASEALTRGATSTTVQQMPGRVTGGGTGAMESYVARAEKIAKPYRAVF